MATATEWVIKGLETFHRPVLEEDTVDRVNYYMTPWILRVFAATVIIKEWAGRPIQCWADYELTSSWEEYLEYYCFVENTYYIPIADPHHKHPGAERTEQLQYYQWVFVILTLQSLCFILPHYFWHALNWIGGIPVEAVVAMARDTATMGEDKCWETYTLIANFLHQAVTLNEDLATSAALSHTPLRVLYTIPQFTLLLLACLVRMFFGRNVYLTPVYLITKLLYVINAFVQLVFMCMFVGDGGLDWGIHLITHLHNNRQWNETGIFPRITWCDATIRKDVKHIVPYTMQCVLALNMLNEKIFLFFYCWLILLIIINCFSLIHWCLKLLPRGNREAFLYRLLAAHGIPERGLERLVEEFVDETPLDIVLTLRIVSSNIGDVNAAHILAAMWEVWLEEREKFPLPPSLVTIGPPKYQGLYNTDAYFTDHDE